MSRDGVEDLRQHRRMSRDGVGDLRQGRRRFQKAPGGVDDGGGKGGYGRMEFLPEFLQAALDKGDGRLQKRRV
jgi:parvulin-like peptidyl-prolyl isomerase